MSDERIKSVKVMLEIEHADAPTTYVTIDRIIPDVESAGEILSIETEPLFEELTFLRNDRFVKHHDRLIKVTIEGATQSHIVNPDREPLYMTITRAQEESETDGN